MQGIKTVVIDKLPFDTQAQDLVYELRQVFGDIITRCEIPLPRRGNSYCHAFVEFENKDQAAKALEQLKGVSLDGIQLNSYVNAWFHGQILLKKKLILVLDSMESMMHTIIVVISEAVIQTIATEEWEMSVDLVA